MKSTLCILFTLFSLLIHGQSTNAGVANSIVQLGLSPKPVNIGREVLFFEDKTGKKSFTEILQQDGFISKNTDIPNFNITRDAIWGKVNFACVQNANCDLKKLNPP